MITSRVKYLGNLRTECTHVRSGNSMITDAPPDNHGRGEAFSPTDMCATSLATCMMTVMGIAANGRKIEIYEMEAEVTKIMADNPRRISEIVVNLTMKTNADEEQKEILEKIARTCPVALSLHPDIRQDISITMHS